MAFNEKAGHWYDAAGNARHTILGKNGKERPTTLKDAREQHLYPSVTSVLKILEAPQLTDWKLYQAALFAPQVPRLPDEAEKTWVGRIMQMAFAQVDEAAELGKAIHAALEKHFGGEPYDEALKVYVEPVDRWMAANGINVLAREVSLVDKVHGFAGTADLIVGTSAGMGVGDFKSKRSNPKYPMTPYEGHTTQIAAYVMAQFGEIADNATGFNLMISSTEPGRVEGTFYDAAKLRKEWEVFQHILAIWFSRKGYDPRIPV